MCHGSAVSFFPEGSGFTSHQNEIQALVFTGEKTEKNIAILPDIYGCNPFYQGLAAHLAKECHKVFLIDIFSGLGDIPKATREAAFERRHKLKDKQFVDQFEAFAIKESIDGVVGFCLGGLYIFELARRNLNADLVAFYPFPQGLPNQDALQVPFEYLGDVSKSHTVLVGDQDASLVGEHLSNLRSVANSNSAIDLNLFPGSGHGFLADLDSTDQQLQKNARNALEICENVLTST